MRPVETDAELLDEVAGTMRMFYARLEKRFTSDPENRSIAFTMSQLQTAMFGAVRCRDDLIIAEWERTQRAGRAVPSKKGGVA